VGRAMAGHDGQDAAHPTDAQAASCDVTIVAHDIGAVGGMEHALAELILGLRRRGDRVTVIARTCDLPPDAGVEFHRVRGPSRPVLLAYPWFMLAGSLAVRRWRRGVVQTTGAIVLNRVDVIAVHFCQQAGRVTPSRSSAVFRAHSFLVRRLVRLAERLSFSANRPATFVGVSEGVADEVRSHYPRVARRVISIPNGVDTEVFAPGIRQDEARALRRKLGVGDGRLVAAFVGSEWERKGLEALLRALPLASDWDAVVAGGGDRKRYEELADSLGVADRVHWLGVSRDVQLVYELADALVFPSSYEAFSLVTLEAAASGLPILATPVNGIRELIADGESGFVISQDPSVIAGRLNRLASDPDLRGRMGRAARASALGFSWEAMVAKHHALYLRLSSESGSEPRAPVLRPRALEGRH
jgi:glycosyltransferase involved in cell wall biosynthesis